MSGLMWFLLEITAAVLLLAGIVWLTWPGKSADDADKPDKN